jgi:hypothetical protein
MNNVYVAINTLSLLPQIIHNQLAWHRRQQEAKFKLPYISAFYAPRLLLFV